jgi:hypothetical protein
MWLTNQNPASPSTFKWKSERRQEVIKVILHEDRKMGEGRLDISLGRKAGIKEVGVHEGKKMPVIKKNYGPRTAKSERSEIESMTEYYRFCPSAHEETSSTARTNPLMKTTLLIRPSLSPHKTRRQDVHCPIPRVRMTAATQPSLQLSLPFAFPLPPPRRALILRTLSRHCLPRFPTRLLPLNTWSFEQPMFVIKTSFPNEIIRRTRASLAETGIKC